MSKIQEVTVDPGETVITIHHALDFDLPKLITIRWAEGDPSFNVHIEGETAEDNQFLSPNNSYLCIAEIWDCLDQIVENEHYKVQDAS